MPDISKLYKHRFDEANRSKKLEIWKTLCEHFFQNLIGENKIIVDMASGYGEFSTNIRGKEKIAVDLNPDAESMLPGDVEFHNISALDMSNAVGGDRADIVFTSNFLEHLYTKEDCDQVLREVFTILKPGGRFVVMGPNIKYLAGAYWDFYDHYLPLSHLSLEEGLIQTGFTVEKTIPRFLPYTTRSALPQGPFLISLYLKLSVFWPLLGKQFLVVGRKPAL